MFDYTLGSRPQTRSILLSSTNADVDTAASETVWPTGGTYTFPAAIAAVEVVSASAADAEDGTGARTVQVYGLNSSGLAATETVTLNGVTAVATTGTWLRINGARALTVGSGGTNAGVISVRALADTPVYATIAAGENESTMCVYSVPVGLRVYVASISASTTSANTGTLDVLVNGGLAKRVATMRFGNLGAQQSYRCPPSVDGPADIWLRVTASADNTPVTAQLEMLETAQ